MLSVSPLGVWRGGRKVGGEVRFLLAFLDFQMLFLRGDACHFSRGLFFMFFCVSQECPHASNLPSFCDFRVHFCRCLCTFRCLFFVLLAPTALCLDTSHTIWRIFPSLGGARPQCDETRQPRHPQCAFWSHPGFAFGTILDALLLIFPVL